jgi:hypothetical protein
MLESSTQVNVGRRNRAFEAPELIKTFTDLERRLASPTGHTGAANRFAEYQSEADGLSVDSRSIRAPGWIRTIAHGLGNRRSIP